MIIFLTGMMGTGKTAVGKILAQELKFTFVDLDCYLEKKTGKPISEIFHTEGEEAFRQMERNIKYDAIPNSSNLVIATGGGFPVDPENQEWMQSRGLIFWLQAEPETILGRLKNTQQRPLLPQPVQVSHIREILSKRTFVYKKANYYIQTDGKSVREIVREILKHIDESHA